jgi:hypothetical protein
LDRERFVLRFELLLLGLELIEFLLQLQDLLLKLFLAYRTGGSVGSQGGLGRKEDRGKRKTRADSIG